MDAGSGPRDASGPLANLARPTCCMLPSATQCKERPLERKLEVVFITIRKLGSLFSLFVQMLRSSATHLLARRHA